jgi:NADH-quinone oxidoreductase subunit M
MLLLLLILIPLIGGFASFFVPQPGRVKSLAFLVSIAAFLMTLYALTLPQSSELVNYNHYWISTLNSHFSLALDGAGKVTTLLTTLSFPIIFLATWKNDYKNANQYYGFMLLTMAGLTGVFLATDCLLFYFFWELALIPAYFLCSIWGGEKRIQVSFKFFIYTFVGSLLMLIGIIYVYYRTPDQSFAWSSMIKATLSNQEQAFFFWFFFVAFAIKMPIFPFHTWQPDTYEQAPTGTTMVLSGIMVKMGLFAVIRWLLPVFPEMSTKMAPLIIVLSITGILYASLIAIKQDDLKRLVAYSSIAHIGLMCAALFVQNQIGYDGVLIQMFNHGINIIGLWIVIDLIEQQTGIRKMSQLGGLARQAPALAILLVVIALANIALPLTNGFVGEFLMFNALFQYNPWYAFAAGIGIILAAVYTLGMIQKVFYGENNGLVTLKDVKANQAFALISIIILVISLGVFPKPILQLTQQGLNGIITFATK